MLPHQLLTSGRLQRSKMEDASRITFNDKTHSPGAEIADAVKEDGGRGGTQGDAGMMSSGVDTAEGKIRPLSKFMIFDLRLMI
jgi:hypothetical protein